MMTFARKALLPLLAALVLGGATAGCSMVGGSAAPLSAGLSARMDQPGASLNRAEAIGLVNNLRASSGAGRLSSDATLDATAQQLAAQYAASGNSPKLPAGVTIIRVSAGYPTFAETFSGWRNSSADAAALTDRSVTRAGVASVYTANSGYGVYWVLLLAP